MRVFISWSGDRSHRVASAVHEWISVAFPALDPWLSSEMEKGKSWANKLLDGLTTSTLGILCVTAEANHDWMAFEAGALLDAAGDGRSLVVVLIDPDPVQLAASPIGAFAAFTGDDSGLRAFAIHLGRQTEHPISEQRADELSATLLSDITAIGTAKVRDFELNLVLPEGAHTQPFAPLHDMEWLSAIEGIVDALRREMAWEIADYDFASFSYLDMRKAEWIPPPKRISSITTDQLALVHPSYFEQWYGNARLATEILKSNFQLDASLKARNRREHIRSDSAFLYAFYLLQLPNPHLRHGEIVNLLRNIQELPGIPRSWRFEIPVLFLVEPDVNKLEKELDSKSRLLAQVISLGFSYASIRDAISFFGVSVTSELLRRVVAQFRQELETIAPPDKVRTPIMEMLDRLEQTENQDELITMWTSLDSAVRGLVQWLHAAL
ncbi:MAG TPA: TIR domain-containing protein [Pyrinomonadaceae bacterium]|nr:TIR domain-containing protein [Pyrinomonadaceae bacterium]